MKGKGIRVLYFSSFGHLAGGGQISLMLLASGLGKSHFIPFVVVPEDGPLGERLRKMGIPAYSIALPPISPRHCVAVVKTFFGIVKLGRRLRIDIFHTDGPRNTFYAGLASMICGSKLVWSIRAEASDPHDRLLGLLADKIVLVADALRSRFRPFQGTDKLVTVYNGISLQKFCPRRPKMSSTGDSGKARIVIGTVGRVEAIKGHHILLEAIGILRPRYPHIRLLIAGGVSDPQFAAECRNIIDRYGLTETVRFIGHIDDLPGFLNELDVFVLPSLSEAFPRALLESMAAGRASIATDVGGCSEAVENNVSGIVVPKNNSAALAEKIEFLIKNEQVRKQMGFAARKRVERYFSIENNIKRMERIYKELITTEESGWIGRGESLAGTGATDERRGFPSSPRNESDRTSSCHFCGRRDFRSLEIAQDLVRVLQCRNCSLVFVDPQPGAQHLSEHYDRKYYRSWLSEQRSKRVKMWEQRLKGLERHKTPGRLLDVGCGEGLFLEVAQNRGWDVTGTEISKFAAEHAAEATGAKVYHGELTNAGFVNDRFDVVTLWHVLEHVRDPLSYLAEARRLLASGGVMVVAVPNLHNEVMKLAYRIFKGKRLKLYEPQEKELHLFHFSDRTLSRLMKRAGFRVLHIGPDLGLVDSRKRAVDALAIALSKLLSRRIYNSLEVIATGDKRG